ncbi:MAG: hypothetical protein WBI40_01095 [Methylococcaceae bacterium]
MSNFNDFLKSIKTGDSLPSKSESQKVVATAFNDALVSTMASKSIGIERLFSGSGDKTLKFAEKVSELAHSDDFLNEFSDDIGLPKDNESEDDFVERAKSTMKTLLMKKLSK